MGWTGGEGKAYGVGGWEGRRGGKGGGREGGLRGGGTYAAEELASGIMWRRMPMSGDMGWESLSEWDKSVVAVELLCGAADETSFELMLLG